MGYLQQVSSEEKSITVWDQVYQSSIDIPELKVLDIRDHSRESLHDVLTSWQSDFDLEGGPLFQFGYLKGYEDGSSRIYIAMHHMLVDGVSWRILAEDIKRLYLGESLPSKGSSYRQWVSRISDYVASYPEELSYWSDQLEGLPSYEVLRSEEGPVHLGFELSKKDTDVLLRRASNAYNTEVNDLLLTALGYSLRDLNQGNIQGITLEGHGREDLFSTIDHSRTVGWFTSMFPVKFCLLYTSDAADE